jgi:hypothetical protein
MTVLLTVCLRAGRALVFALLGLSAVRPSALPAQSSATAAPRADTLRVREGGASRIVAPQASITVGFDRTVRDLGTDSAVPRVRIMPAVPVRITWRDPVTLRVTPLEPLVPGQAYTIVVDSPLVATDGARLFEPVTVVARVPAVVRRSTQPALRGDTVTVLSPRGRVTLFMSGQVDSARWAKAVTVRLDGGSQCTSGARAYQLVRQRLPLPGEPVLDRFVRQHNGMRRTDTLTRVLDFEPDGELPADCSGVLTMQGPGDGAAADSFRVRTTPAFRLQPLPACNGAPCAAQHMVRLDFSTPLADVHRSSLRVAPEAPSPFVRWISPTAALIPTRADPGASVRVEVAPSVRDVYGRELVGARSWSVRVPDRQPAVSFAESGFVIWPRRARESVRVHHTNASLVELRVVRLAPRAFMARARATNYASLDTDFDAPHETIGDTITVRHRVSAPRNMEGETRVPLPAAMLSDPNHAWHVAVRLIEALPSVRYPPSPFATVDSLRVPGSAFVLARSNLMVHAQLTGAPSAVFVTDVRSGVPVERVAVTLLDSLGRTLASAHTGADGTAALELGLGETAWTSARDAARLLQVAQRADTLRLPLVETDWLMPPQAGFKYPPSWAGYSSSSPVPAFARLYRPRSLSARRARVRWRHAAGVAQRPRALRPR